MINEISYVKRRENLLSKLNGNSMLVMSHPSYLRNADNEYPYRQDSFLYYLTGFSEPECALLVLPHRPKGDRFHFFLREKDKLTQYFIVFIPKIKRPLEIDNLLFPFSLNYLKQHLIRHFTKLKYK